MQSGDTVRWGILGSGNIARQFAAGLRRSTRNRAVAVGSRSFDAARTFAQSFEIPLAFGDYDALLSDDSFDAVYISLPNALHHEWTIKALRTGKHVLCEKPLAMDEQQAREMFDTASQC